MIDRLVPAVLLTTLFGAGDAAAHEAGGPLIYYVAREDASCGWVERRAGALGAGRYAELTLTSQTWQGIDWRHQLFVIEPSAVAAGSRHALLVIGGGVWRDEDAKPDGNTAPPAEVAALSELAELLRTPVALLRHVPHQPLFGLLEDPLIALSFQNYLRTGDPEWPLLLPMVKSAVRGMDAVQAYAAREWSLDLATFTVTGASKRGWTTWLTGAVDDRVTAMAPVVIDMLNLEAQLEHHRAAWGVLSPMLHAYTALGLHEHIDSPAGQALLAAVDPYSHRDRLTQPKLIALDTNDPYWPLDALNVYWDDLRGRNFILYVPNAGHGLAGDERLLGSLGALHRHAALGARLPELSWTFDEADGRLTLRVESDIAPREVVAWVAESPSRDFRAARWASRATRNEGGGYAFDLAIPEAGYAAVFAEAVYDHDAAPPYTFSTNVRIVGGE